MGFSSIWDLFWVVRRFETEDEGGEVQFEVIVNNGGEKQHFSGSIQPDDSTVDVGMKSRCPRVLDLQN